MIIGTAGHIDHGKTSLIKALTAVDTDRLKEEKQRGISIDLGFAYQDIPGAEGAVLGFVDVPGHEKFVHTMLAGAASIDFVLLLVAADDGVMPQTREHLAILDLLGIENGIVVISKADLVDSTRIDMLSQEIGNLLQPTGLANLPILAVSSASGAGLAELRHRLHAAALAMPARRADGRFRLAVDRCFTMQGSGTVVTGTILSGRVRNGEQLVVSPQGRPVRLRSLRAQNRIIDVALAGDRAALNLAGDGLTKEDIARGDMVLNPGLHAPTSRIDATLRLLASQSRPIGDWFAVRLHHASVEVGARIVPLSAATVQPGAEHYVQLVLDRPIAAASGDRFVIRDVSAQHTLGGGAFLDLRAPLRKRRSAQRLDQLRAMHQSDWMARLAGLLSIPPYHVDLTAFLRDGALPEDASVALAALQAVTLPDKASQIVMLPQYWQEFCRALQDELQQFHLDNPDLTGMAVERLRLKLQPRLPVAAFRAAISLLIRDGLIALDGAWLRLASHQARMSQEDALLWHRIMPLLGSEERFRPPRTRDIAGLTGEAEETVRRLLRLAGRMGHVHEVAHDHFFLRATIAELLQILVDMDETFDNGWFIAARFRDRVDSGRKVAIQILEFFDRNGVTVRRGDLRRLNRRKLDLFGSFEPAPDQALDPTPGL